MSSIFIALLMYGCGLEPLKPLPPLGCKDMQPVCVCNEKGICYWQFICAQYD